MSLPVFWMPITAERAEKVADLKVPRNPDLLNSVVGVSAHFQGRGNTCVAGQVVALFLRIAVAWFPVPVVAEIVDNDFEEKPWVEIEAQLPSFPQPEDLVPFKVGAISTTQFLLDTKSLSAGSDGVIRYTLIVVSASGARNVSYEGMRCATVERKSYAFGHADHTWSKARDHKWVRVQGTSNNPYVDLYTNYFCTVGAPSFRSADDIVRVVRKGGNPR